ARGSGHSDQQAFHDHDVAPLAVKPAMPFVSPNLAKSLGAKERPAGGILGKDSRDEFPEPCFTGGVHEFYKSQAPGALPSCVTGHINRKLRDARITWSRSVGRSRRERHRPPGFLYNHDRMLAVEPGPDFVGAARVGFE